MPSAFDLLSGKTLSPLTKEERENVFASAPELAPVGQIPGYDYLMWANRMDRDAPAKKMVADFLTGEGSLEGTLTNLFPGPGGAGAMAGYVGGKPQLFRDISEAFRKSWRGVSPDALERISQLVQAMPEKQVESLKWLHYVPKEMQSKILGGDAGEYFGKELGTREAESILRTRVPQTYHKELEPLLEKVREGAGVLLREPKMAGDWKEAVDDISEELFHHLQEAAGISNTNRAHKELKAGVKQFVKTGKSDYLDKVTEIIKQHEEWRANNIKPNTKELRFELDRATSEAVFAKRKAGKEATTPALEGSERLRNIETANYPKETERLQALQTQFGQNLEKRGIKQEEFFDATAGLPTKDKMRLLSDLVGEKDAKRLLKEAGVE